ncbi:hypothetical protein WMO40_21165 [Bacillaceae bacterium CLA-AA-H227]|uniref:Uncharacterized protein n=1 Tax=Robertmurraya yapensis (ex Hitch et al 2024) TaxID=3133160 RepID=A0ACC6SGM9_9BACI
MGLEKSKDVKINIRIKPEYESDVETNLLLLQFLNHLSKGEDTLAFKNLLENRDIIVAPNFSFDGEFKDLEKDLIFIERLYKIENYYRIDFQIPEQMDKDDWEDIQKLEYAMENKPTVHNLNRLTIELTDLETVSNIIELFDGEKIQRKLMIQQTGSDARLELFGATIPLEKVETIYNSLKVDGIERLKRKLELMDEGESIRIVLLPGDDPVFSEYYYFKKEKSNY